MLCRSFLQHLNRSLDPVKEKKSSSKQKPVDPLISRRGGLQLLTSLTLSHAHMSKASIQELQVDIYQSRSQDYVT
jgi:hypothetical protein